MPGIRHPALWGVLLAALCAGWCCGLPAAVAQGDAAAPAEAVPSPPPESSAVNAHFREGRVARLIERFTYAAIILVLLLCGMGLPLPEEIPILTSAVLSHSGHLRPWWALGACLFGVMLGDSIMFLLGQRWGTHVLDHRLSRKLLTAERQEKIEHYFARYGAWIIFAARFLPGIRAPLFLTAGSMRVPFWKFFSMDGAAALLSIPASFWIAYYFTDKLEDLLNARDRVHYWAMAILAVGMLGWLVLHRWWERRRAAQAGVGESTAAAGGGPHSPEAEALSNRRSTTP